LFKNNSFLIYKFEASIIDLLQHLGKLVKNLLLKYFKLLLRLMPNMKDLSTYGVQKLGFVIRLKHENGNGLRECPKTQAHSHMCENVQGNELNTFK